MGRSRRQQILDEFRKTLQVAAGTRRFVPMWSRLHVYVRNPALAAFPVDADTPPDVEIAVPGPELPELYGGLWDTLHERWVPDAAPESAEEIQVFPVAANQVDLVTKIYTPVMRQMILGGPGAGKTRVLSLSSLHRGGGLLERRSHLTWGMVGATNERVRDVVVKDIDAIIPPAWVDDKITEAKVGNFIRLVNGCHFEFISGQEPSKAKGTKIQGRSWNGAGVDETQNLHDRVQMDIDERGRREGRRFFVQETATNFGLGHFELRKERYKSSRFHRLDRLNPLDNPWIDPGYWQRFKEFYSDHDWRQRVMAEDVAPEQLVYSDFTFNGNLMPAPRSEHLDVTREITRERFQMGRGFDWVVGTDWGTLCTVSIWLKAFRSPKYGDIEWWAMHEITSGSHTHAGQHAKKLATFRSPGDFIVVADPGINTKDVDKSDYELARREGLTVRPAYHEPIRVKHRISMMKALLCDSAGRRRLFVDCDNNRQPKCPKLVQSFLTQQYDDRGNPENVRKDYSDPTHWPAATAYGLFPFERIRGRSTFDLVTGGVDPEVAQDPVLVKAREIHQRRSM